MKHQPGRPSTDVLPGVDERLRPGVHFRPRAATGVPDPGTGNTPTRPTESGGCRFGIERTGSYLGGFVRPAQHLRASSWPATPPSVDSEGNPTDRRPHTRGDHGKARRDGGRSPVSIEGVKSPVVVVPVADRASAKHAPRRASNQRERLSPQVAKRVRDMIMTGVVGGNKRLRTEHLAEQLGVSATPVREALMSLTGEGMVDFEPGRGFSVVPLTRQDVLDVYDMQAYLSGELAARATGHLTEDDFATLAELQATLVAAVDADDSAVIEQMDFQIHQLINRAAAAPKLAWMLSLTLRYVPFTAHADVPGWALAARDDHVWLLRALRSRNPATARDFMQAHIRHAGDLLVEFLADQGVLHEGASL